MKHKGKRRNAVRKIIIFLIFELTFSLITAPFLLFYGPFDNIKRVVVGASMNTLNHQYISKLFLSEDAIRGILRNTYAVDPTALGEKVEMLRFGNDKSNKIEIFNIKGRDFKGKLMMVYDPTRIQVGYSESLPKTGETTSAIAKRIGAIGAINAGGFLDEGWTGTGGVPMGFIIHEGEVVYNKLGDENTEQDTAAFTKDGMLIVGTHSIAKLKELEIKEGVSFGPPLIVNGKPTITKGDGGWGIAPRTAIGQKKTGEVLLLVIDGRSLNSFGATLKEVQDILLEYGAVNAVNLDGGSSTTMYFNGSVINNPSDKLGERAVPSGFMIK